MIYVFASVILGVLSDLLVFGGAHPECATNDSVGPCEYVPRVTDYVTIIAIMLAPFFFIFLLRAYTINKNRKRQIYGKNKNN